MPRFRGARHHITLKIYDIMNNRVHGLKLLLAQNHSMWCKNLVLIQDLPAICSVVKSSSYKNEKNHLKHLLKYPQKNGRREMKSIVHSMNHLFSQQKIFLALKFLLFCLFNKIPFRVAPAFYTFYSPQSVNRKCWTYNLWEVRHFSRFCSLKYMD